MFKANKLKVDEADPVLKAFEDNRAKFIQIMKDLRKKHPEMDPTELEKLAEYEIINQGPKSRAFYRYGKWQNNFVTINKFRN